MSPVRRARRGSAQNGQVLVIMVLAVVALLAASALVVDGGNAFAQQRVTQNAADSAANAGAVVLMQDLVASNNQQPLPNSDAAVLQAVQTKAVTDNGISTISAYYTTITGQCILAGGSVASPPCTTAPGAVPVGNGTIPTVSPDGSGKQQCPLPPGTPASTPALACGVAVYGSKSFGTFVARVVGVGSITASAQATAVAGVATTICPADQPCSFVPITFPTTLTLCGNTGGQLNFGSGADYKPIVGQALTSSNESIIGICGSGSGTVGWLAIAPEDTGVGCNGAIPDLTCDIQTPDNPALTLPIWIQTVSGNTNSTNVTQAMNTYAGPTVGTYEPGLDKLIVIPLYDCVGTVSSQSSTDTCAQAQSVQGGQNNWFHVVGVLGFVLDQAYINNSNPQCNQAPGAPVIQGNGKDGCLKGWIVNVSIPGGTIGLGNGAPGSAFGVQLIH